MNKKSLLVSSLTALALMGCDGSSDEGTEPVFKAFMEAIEFTDANLKACVEQTIEDQDINQSAQLTHLDCEQPIVDASGLENFYSLESINLATAGMSCEEYDQVQKQLNLPGFQYGRNEPIDVQQTDECFYNELEFADAHLRECVVNEYNLNGWASTDDLTVLSCTNSAIKSIAGLEVFTELMSLDITETSVNCAEAFDFDESNPNTTVANPSVCNISNIDFSAPVEQCVTANTPESGLVIHLEALTCADENIIDLTGLDLLTSLKTLDIYETGTDCQSITLLKQDLPETEMFVPEQCVLNADMLLTNLPRPYPVLDEAGEIAYVTFPDPKTRMCYERLTENKTKLGQVTQLKCGWNNEDERGLGSFEGAEYLLFVKEVAGSHSVVQDLSPLYNLPALTHIDIAYNLVITTEQYAELGEHQGANITHLRAMGMSFVNLDALEQFTAAIELNLSSSNLRFDPEASDWGAIPKMTSLKTLLLKKNKIQSLQHLHVMTALEEINIQEQADNGILTLPCTEVDALQAALPDLNIIQDAKTCFE
ncbi:hypothetical protein RGQ13_03570 [Thalassotalea psychrophila]|uniref:Leucine-rich repeat domain-containing protein n=1 Tax=Thalassotalea psychrophila TaxID=3065647 RepID=A0ABY9TX34_9GAMM|nr:hypothetical protein RGQ13_03570 [Colwelliaceae bacterium SQ149]